MVLFLEAVWLLSCFATRLFRSKKMQKRSRPSSDPPLGGSYRDDPGTKIRSTKSEIPKTKIQISPQGRKDAGKEKNRPFRLRSTTGFSFFNCFVVQLFQ